MPSTRTRSFLWLLQCVFAALALSDATAFAQPKKSWSRRRPTSCAASMAAIEPTAICCITISASASSRRSAEGVNKKMALVGISAAERDDVGKIQAQLLRDVRKNGAAFMPYGSVSSTTLLDKTSGKTRFFIEWATP